MVRGGVGGRAGAGGVIHWGTLITEKNAAQPRYILDASVLSLTQYFVYTTLLHIIIKIISRLLFNQQHISQYCTCIIPVC